MFAGALDNLSVPVVKGKCSISTTYDNEIFFHWDRTQNDVIGAFDSFCEGKFQICCALTGCCTTEVWMCLVCLVCLDFLGRLGFFVEGYIAYWHFSIFRLIFRLIFGFVFGFVFGFIFGFVLRLRWWFELGLYRFGKGLCLLILGL